MRSKRPQTFTGFGRGLNSESQVYKLNEEECRDCLNVTSTVRGSVRKRDGTQTVATLGTALTSLYASVTPEFLIAAGGTVLYSIAPNGTTATIKTGMANGAQWDWISAPAVGGQGPLYGMNGTDAQQWAGTGSTAAWTATTGAFPTGAKYLAYHANRAFAAGMTAYGGVADPKSLVVASGLADPRNWSTSLNDPNLGWAVQFDPNDGEAISGIGRCGPYLLVTKPSKAWIVYDLDFGANRELGQNAGCVSHRSIAEGPTGCIFLGREDLWVTDGSSVRSISRGRVGDKIRSIAAGARQQASGAYWEGSYYLAASTTGATNNMMLSYDTQLDSFWQHSSTEADLAVWAASAGASLYGANSQANRIDRLYVPNEIQDNGQDFSAHWSSPFYVFGSPQVRKRVWRIHFDGKGRIQTSISRDFDVIPSFSTDTDFQQGAGGLWGVDDGGLWGVDDGGVWGAGREVSEAEILTPGVSRAWSVTVGNVSADPFEVDSVTFELADRDRR